MTAPIKVQPARHGLTAVYIGKHLTRYEQAELRVRLGVRIPADLEYLARQRRREAKA